jgi:hypothetical protein
METNIIPSKSMIDLVKKSSKELHKCKRCTGYIFSDQTYCYGCKWIISRGG